MKHKGGKLTVAQLDRRITAIHKSTRTTVPAFIPVHNWFRLHNRLYYNWHLKSFSSAVHWVVLILFILAGTVFDFRVLSGKNETQQAKAAYNEYIWTGLGGGGNAWCLDGNWDKPGCPTLITDKALINAPTASNITIETGAIGDEMELGELEISGAYTGTVTILAGKNLKVDNIILSAGKLNDNGRTVTVNGNISISDSNPNQVLQSTGTWVQAGSGNIGNPYWGGANDNRIKSYQINAGATATRTGRFTCSKLIMQNGATLAASDASNYTVVEYISGDDPVDLTGSAAITTAGLNLYPTVAGTYNQKAINIGTYLGVGYTPNTTVKLTGNWSTGGLGIVGSGASGSEATAMVLDTNGHNLNISGDIQAGRDDIVVANYYGKILFKNGTHSITGDLKGPVNNATSHGYFDMGSSNINVGGDVNLTNANIVGANTGRITLNGSAAQSVTCNSQSLYNLDITNGTAGGINFADSCIVSNNFTATTAGSQLTFKDGATYALANILISGAAGNLVRLQSSASGTQWLLNVTAATPSASYVNVSDSNASGGSQIDASDGTSTNGGNNINWLFSAHPTTTTTTTSSSSSTTSSTSSSSTTTSTTESPSPTITSTTTTTTTSTPPPGGDDDDEISPVEPPDPIDDYKPVHPGDPVKIRIKVPKGTKVIGIVVDGTVSDLANVAYLKYLGADGNYNIYQYILKNGVSKGKHAVQFYGIDKEGKHTVLSGILYLDAKTNVFIVGNLAVPYWLLLLLLIIVFMVGYIVWKRRQDKRLKALFNV